MSSSDLARQFLKRLANDLVTGNDAVSMEAFVEGLLKDGNGNPLPPDQAAQALINSLQALNRATNDPAKWAPIEQKITDILSGGGTPAQIAQKFLDAGDPQKTKQADNFWFLFNQANADFKMVFTDAQLAQLKYALNRIVPGMGDLFSKVLGGIGGRDGAAPDQQIVYQGFEGGFNAMMRGQVSLASFWGAKKDVEYDAQGKPLEKPYNLWNPPSDPADWQNFFKRSSEIPAHQVYKFHSNYPDEMKMTFEDMVLAKWEKDGLVQFADDAARADFIAFAKQQVLGGTLDGAFAQNLEMQGVVGFSSEAARQAFIAQTQNLDTRFMDEEMLAEAVIRIAESMPGVELLAADPAFDPQVTYASAKERIANVAQLFAPADNGADFARNAENYIAAHPGIQSNFGAVAPTSASPSAGAATVAGGAGPTAPASVAPTAVPAVQLQHHVVPPGPVQFEYGAATYIDGAGLSKFGFKDPMTAYNVAPDGTLNVQSGAAGNLEVRPGQIDQILSGDGFYIQNVKVGGALQGYFVSDAQGNGFFLDASAIDVSTMDPQAKQAVFDRQAAPSAAPTAALSMQPGVS